MFTRRFPYTNLQDINLDWIVKQVRKLTQMVESIDPTVIAEEVQTAIDTADAAMDTANAVAGTADAALTTAQAANARSVNAQTAATEAASAAAAAQTTADDAATAAGSAATAASGAATAAAAAQTTADNAATAASGAASAAAAAQTTADNAATAASNAATAAAAAQTTADGAATAATAAQTAATNAATAAAAAQTTADGKQDEIQARGLLVGMGNGSIAAAAVGIDYGPTVFSVMLYAASWSGTTYILSNPNILSGSYVYIIAPIPASLNIYASCGIYADSVQVDGLLTFQCTTPPSNDLTVQIVREKCLTTV